MHSSFWPLLEIWGIIVFMGFFLFKAGQWTERAKIQSKYTSWVPKDSVRKSVQTSGVSIFGLGRMRNRKNILRVIANTKVDDLTPSNDGQKKVVLSVAAANGRIIKNKGEQHGQ